MLGQPKGVVGTQAACAGADDGTDDADTIFCNIKKKSSHIE